MPEEPRGRKRPTTRIGNAFRATRIGTGEAEEGREPESLAAVSGRRDGAAQAGATARRGPARSAPTWTSPGS